MILPIIMAIAMTMAMGNHTMDMNMNMTMNMGKGHTGCPAYIARGNISTFQKEGLVYECVPSVNYDANLDIIHHIEQHGLNLTLHFTNGTLITILLLNTSAVSK
jgi:hypothetical protein